MFPVPDLIQGPHAERSPRHRQPEESKEEATIKAAREALKASVDIALPISTGLSAKAIKAVITAKCPAKAPILHGAVDVANASATGVSKKAIHKSIDTGCADSLIGRVRQSCCKG